MEHILDNPVWHALNSENKLFGEGNTQAKYFHEDISLFIGLKEINQDNFDALFNMLPYKYPAAIISNTEVIFLNQNIIKSC